MDECLSRTKNATDLLLKLERSGHTRNDRYYRECKDKFLTCLKLQRGLASGNSVLQGLGRMASPDGPQPHAQFIAQVTQAKGLLQKAGFPEIDNLQLAKLLKPEASDPALEDIASASAGFEGTPHRIALPHRYREALLNHDYQLRSIGLSTMSHSSSTRSSSKGFVKTWLKTSA